MYTRPVRVARKRLARHLRQASTAAALQPRSPAPPAPAPSGAGTSKWARPPPPPPRAAPPSTAAGSSRQPQAGPSSASAKSKWALPPPAPSASSAPPAARQPSDSAPLSSAPRSAPGPSAYARPPPPASYPPAAPAPTANVSKWAAPPLRAAPVPETPANPPSGATAGASRWARPAPAAPTSSSSKWAMPAAPQAPRATVQAAHYPPAAAASKWAKSMPPSSPTPPPPHQQQRQQAAPAAPGKWAQPASRVPPAYTALARQEAGAFGLQRDVAPHQHGSAPPQRPQAGETASDKWAPRAPAAPAAAKREGRVRVTARERLLAEAALAGTPAPAPQYAPRVRKAKEIRAARVDVYIPSTCSVGNLARLLGVRLSQLTRVMVAAGMADEARPEHLLTADYASLLAAEFDRNPIVSDEKAFDVYPPPPAADPTSLPARPPVVTIMGHVDHGKTTLLDSLRSASVAAGEAGGITQHIGAFSVPVGGAGADGSTITFLDTPGHAAFAAMRARGARVTDVVVLVVAADDGVMPQTKEVIELVKRDEGKVGLVVAINKCDKPGADVDKVQRELLVHGIMLEEFGGDVPSVQVSGLTGAGLDTLVETISAVAEQQDLRAERDGHVQGYVLESRVQKGFGAVATVLVLRGCLKPGMHLISGTSTARVRAMSDSAGKPVRAAYAGDAVTVAGWKDVPAAGGEALSAAEADAKRALANRVRAEAATAALGDLDAINAARRAERDAREAEERAALARAEGREVEAPAAPAVPTRKELNVVVKGDVSGSVEAVAGALIGIGNNVAGLRIVHTGVGDVTETDVQLAQTAEGVIVAFSVGVPRGIAQLAAQNGVSIAESPIIYKLMDDMKERVVALLPKIRETRVAGEATVLQMFDINVKAKQTVRIAGCRVGNGVLEKDKIVRVLRDGETIFEGPLETLKHLKKDVTEVRKGMECGVRVRGFEDFREGDALQFIEIVEKPGHL